MPLPPDKSFFIQTVMHKVPALLVHNEPGVAHDPQMLRYGALGNAQPRGEGVDAQRPALEKLDNAHARGHGQHLQYSSKLDWVIHCDYIDIC